MNTIYHIARADFRERTRRYSFFVTLAVTVYAAYLFLPPDGGKYITMQMDGHRGIYNSAWVGTLVAILSGLFLALAGFYLVKNSLRRDRLTRVGEIVAATRVRKTGFLLGKAASNFAVLAAMTVVLVIAAAAMQLARGEDTHIHLWQLAAPFLVFTIPTIAVTAGMAVLFEATPILRGGLGNVIYYFLYSMTIPLGMFLRADLFGMATVLPYMTKACEAAFPSYSAAAGRMSMGFHFKEGGVAWHATTFRWDGIPWSGELLAARIPWLLFALGLVVLAALVFDRFDPARSGGRSKKRRTPEMGAEAPMAAVATGYGAPVSLTPVLSRSPRLRFWGVVRAEWRIMVWKRSVWWRSAAGAMIVAGALLPVDIGHPYILPAAWIWPILLWSAMGTREKRHGTDAMVFSAPHAMSRQFVAAWIAGVALTALAGSGVFLRFLISGNVPVAQMLAVSIVFIPTFALACGVWTGRGMLFEVLYLIVWYVGPMNQVPALDFMAITPESLSGGTMDTFLIVTAISMVLAVVGRWRQMRGEGRT